MAYFDTTWYTHYGDGITTGHFALTKWAATTSIAPGTLRRQLTVTAGNERVFVATQAATQTTGSVEPTWVITRGGRSAIDGAVQWQECTGAAGLNGDLTNSQVWVQNAAISIGATIKNIAGTFLFIASVAGTSKNTAGEPVWNTTAGATTADGTVTWTCIGPVGNFPAWSAPHARLSNATTNTWGAAGNDFYIADNSAETSGSTVTLNIGSTTLPSRVLSVDHTNTTMPPPASALLKGASVTSSNTVTGSLLLFAGTNQQGYIFGVNFIVSANVAAALMTIGNGQFIRVRFEQCQFTVSGTTSGASISVGATSAAVAFDFINCAFSFASSGHFLAVNSGFHAWRATPSGAILGTAPTAGFFRGGASAPPNVLIEGVDLSPIGAGALFINANAAGAYTLKNCKLSASTTIYSGAIGVQMVAHSVDLINTDSGTNVTRNERHGLYGDETTSLTVYRTGGATEGGVGVSHLIAPTSSVRGYSPFNALPLVIWNDLVGSSRTLTVYGCCDVLTTIPNNLAIWMDVEYMGSTATPVGSFVSTGLVTVLDAPTAYSSDSSTWTGSIQSGSRFAMSVTFTPQQKGNVYVYPRAASTTRVILDPLPVIT